MFELSILIEKIDGKLFFCCCWLATVDFASQFKAHDSCHLGISKCAVVIMNKLLSAALRHCQF